MARSLVLLPWLFPAVATATTFLWMFESPEGLFDSIFKRFGHSAPYFLQTSNDALIVVILVNIWIGIPFNYLVVQSGLQTIPPDLHEAAVIDGASWWKELTRVTIPLLRETILTVLMLGIAGTMNVFAFVWILTMGGPADATMLPGPLAYTQAFVEFNYGQGAAIILGVVAVLLCVAFMFLIATRPRSGAGTAGQTVAGQTLASPRFSAKRGVRMTLSPPALAPVEARRRQKERGEAAPPRRSSFKWVAFLRAQLGRLGLVITMFCLLFPIYWLLQSSLSTNLELFHTPAYFFPPHPTFQGFIDAWRLMRVDLLHSLVIATGVVLLDVALAVSAGYGLFLARVRKTATVVRLLVLVGIVFPTITFVIPLDQLLYHLHLLNSYPGLILADSLYSTSLGVLIVYTYMLSIPQEMVEAAHIDGASSTRTLWSVIMPIARPAIAVTAIFAFLTGWGDFLFAETFTSNNNILPASITVYNLSGVAVETGQVVWPEVMAGSLILALPVLLAIIVAQRYIRIGISAGAIKG